MPSSTMMIRAVMILFVTTLARTTHPHDWEKAHPEGRTRGRAAASAGMSGAHVPTNDERRRRSRRLAVAAARSRTAVPCP